MRLSTYFVCTLREDPQEAETPSHRLMLRAGLIRRLSSGSYTWLPAGLRVLYKLTAIIRARMDASGAMEVHMPVVQPASLWQESGRWDKYGPELLRVNDRHNRPHCIAPTHEEVITDLLRGEVNSYRQLPVNLYQIQTKFRDEIRPRFGVMRAREFLMKDAYSFHADQDSLDSTYALMRQTYCAIFDDCGLRYCVVEADSGTIGGSRSHEFHVLSATGEDSIASCPDADFEACNAELISLPAATGERAPPQQDLRREHTPAIKTIAELSASFDIAAARTVKTIVVHADEEHCPAAQVALLVRGDHLLNVVKAGAHPWVREPVEFCSEQDIRAAFGAGPGSLGPHQCPVPVIADYAVGALTDFSAGANEDDYHYFGLNWQRDVPEPALADLRMAVSGDPVPGHSGARLSVERGIEVGHIFQLGRNYSTPMRAQFLDREGKLCDFIMGCYGIGVSRVVAAAIEQNHDERGIVWPESLAPFTVVITALNYDKSTSVRTTADDLYQQLIALGIDVAIDDRPLRPGAKFIDADLLGIPHQIVVGDKGMQRNIVEYKHRPVAHTHEWPVAEAVTRLQERLNKTGQNT